MFKKILALTLAVLFCLGLCACMAPQDEETPEGMQSVTMPGEPFKLYVPENWTPNTTSGISSAYYSTSEYISVSARYYTPADPNMTVEEYIEYCANGYKTTLDSYAESERIAAILGGKDALKLSYTVLQNEKSVTCFQITVKHESTMVSLHGYSSSAMYANVAPQFDKIVSSFVLCEMTDGNGEEEVDKDTPEGMKLASTKKLEYRMYVPKTWVCDWESGKSEAYYPESERSNVALSAVTPLTSVTLADHFTSCENEYKEILPEYQRISEESRTVSDRSALSYTYSTVVDGVEFTIMETIFSKDEVIYSLTYTARSEKFEEHLADVEAILNAFRFR